MSDVNQEWIDAKKAIPFEEGLPKEFQVHDAILVCPECKGEMFGRCLCCQCYFCHGSCEVGIYDEEEIIELIRKKQDRYLV